MQEFPNDENGAEPKVLQENGADLTCVRSIEFSVHSPSNAVSKLIEQGNVARAYKAEIDFDEGELEEGEEITPENEEFSPSWLVYTEIPMVSLYGGISRVQ